MHRKWGASVLLGVGIKTVDRGGPNDNDGTTIKPGVTGGLNLRHRISSFDTSLPFVYYDYSFTRYKLVLAHHLF